jgi:hypothetical protein
VVLLLLQGASQRAASIAHSGFMPAGTAIHEAGALPSSILGMPHQLQTPTTPHAPAGPTHLQAVLALPETHHPVDDAKTHHAVGHTPCCQQQHPTSAQHSAPASPRLTNKESQPCIVLIPQVPHQLCAVGRVRQECPPRWAIGGAHLVKKHCILLANIVEHQEGEGGLA